LDENGFGWVEVKDGMVVAHTGDSKNPTIHKFENDRIVNAMKLYRILEMRLVERKQSNTIFTNTDFYVELSDNLITDIFQALWDEVK